MRLLLHPYVNKFLERIDKKSSDDIKSHLRKLADDPFDRELNIKKLKGRDKKPVPFRLRVKDYRIIYFIIDDEIKVTDIFHRNRGYGSI